MSNEVPLNNLTHRDLRIFTTRSAAYGDDQMCALTFPTEFRSIQAYYPIVFRKASDTGQFRPFALLGFKQGQNLFLTESGWDAPYVPWIVERQPFLIGRDMVVHVDLDSPRISRSAGEALFREHGSASEFLERINSVLLAIHEGVESTVPFIAALLEHELLESFVLDVKLRDGSKHRLTGFYTIKEERLGVLSGAVLEGLARAGHLQPTYMAVASLAHLRDLIERQNRLHAANP